MPVQLLLLDEPLKSSSAQAPYVAHFKLSARSEVLCWSEVASLHEYARNLCRTRFAWWQSLPPEIWISSLIYQTTIPDVEALATAEAMRIDLLLSRQFSDDLKVYLTAGQLVTLRKISYRIRSDFEQYALTRISYRG